jgi:hypothetical protein
VKNGLWSEETMAQFWCWEIALLLFEVRAVGREVIGSSLVAALPQHSAKRLCLFGVFS